jgi:hypothetical protein
MVCLQAWTELALGDDGDADLSDDESEGEWGQLSGSSSSSSSDSSSDGSSASSTYSSSGTSSSSDGGAECDEGYSSLQARGAAAKRRGGIAAAGSMQRLGYESSTGTGWATANSSRSSNSSGSSSGSDADSDNGSSSSSEDIDEQESSIEQGVFGDPDLSFPPHLPSSKRRLGGKAAAGGGVPVGPRSPAAKVAASPSKPRKVGTMFLSVKLHVTDHHCCGALVVGCLACDGMHVLLLVAKLQYDQCTSRCSSLVHNCTAAFTALCAALHQQVYVCPLPTRVGLVFLLRLCRAVLLLLLLLVLARQAASGVAAPLPANRSQRRSCTYRWSSARAHCHR